MNDKFDVITELLSLEAMKCTTGGNLHERLSIILQWHKLSQKKLMNVTSRVSARPLKKVEDS